MSVSPSNRGAPSETGLSRGPFSFAAGRAQAGTSTDIASCMRSTAFLMLSIEVAKDTRR